MVFHRGRIGFGCRHGTLEMMGYFLCGLFLYLFQVIFRYTQFE